MRKTVAILMCLLMFMMILPGQAMANDQAKTDFIANYLKFMDQNMEIQKAEMEKIQSQTVKVNISAQLLDSEYTMSDGTRISDVPVNGAMELTGNMLDGTGKVSFSGQYLDQQIGGILYLSEKGVIIPRDTINTLYEAGIDEFPELGDLASLPEYIVYDMDLSAEDQEMLAQIFEDSSVIYDKYSQIRAFAEELFNVIPADCFYYSDGCAVLDLKTSLLNTSALVMNLKDHRESLAEKFVPIIDQPEDMSDEEFRTFQEEMKSEIITGIESINIKDLAELEIPFTIDEFRIYSTSSSVRTAIRIGLDSDEGSFGLSINSNLRRSADKITSDVKGKIKVDIPDFLMDLAIDAKTSVSEGGETLGMTVNGDIKVPDGAGSGKIKLNMQVDYDSSDKVVLPAVNENNSITIEPDSLNMNYQLEESLNPDGVNVYVNGWPMYFEEVPPVLVDGYTMMPLREFSELSGYDVTWQPPDTIVLSDGFDQQITFKVNSTAFQVGDEVRSTDKAPMIINDHAYVPLRVAAECLGYTVDWDPETKSVLLTSE